MEFHPAATNAFQEPAHTASTHHSSSYAPLYTSSSLGTEPFELEHLESVSINRLKLLKAAEKARSAQQLAAQRPSNAVQSLISAIRRAERTHDMHIPPLVQDGSRNKARNNKIRDDEASHFMLRMALCSDHRAWLLKTEYDLFTARLDGTSAESALKAIEKANGLVVQPVSNSEFDQLRPELNAVAQGPNRQRSNQNVKYYKIAFEQVPTLVRHRKVFLRDGYAYVPQSNILEVVAAQFRSLLSASLITAMKYAPIAERDERLKPILRSIRQHFEADEQSKKAFDPNASIDRISLKELDQSLPAMPLCMHNMMTQLRQNHHLRHSARIQLGVFLKGCGFTMEESLKFWKTEFGKGSITTEKFEKQYAYNIRHQYGKEGKRRNLPPYNCMKVINERPGPGEHNGCPYREFEESRLRMSLRALGTAPDAIPVIVARAKEGNYQAACGMCFAASQPGHHPISEYGLPEFIPDHPNSYFIEARRRRFGPPPEVLSTEEELDVGVDDEQLLMASEAAEAEHGLQKKMSGAEKGHEKENDRARDPQQPGCDLELHAPTDSKNESAQQLECTTMEKADDPTEACDRRKSQPMDVDTPEKPDSDSTITAGEKAAGAT
eukprot:TRINITY_DN1065_c0_g1_i2.p1 TRINITY_DN1065_c0_g1~~TRINITY_DN1065_c0_g1_i2.p1  ORF type:complete len:638 (+),score=102.40 TRINITY_DN1065_c0_g1_i2:90-1916(+)